MIFELTHSVVQRLWDAHRLGKVETLVRSTRGQNNPGALVNESLFLRVDGLPDWQVSRFAGEARAYELLKGSGVPVPQIIALDTSQLHIPHDYMIMTKVAGQPVIDCWQTMSETDRQQVAFEAGRYLALMHQVALPRFGRMYHLPATGFDRWIDVVDDFYRNYRDLGIEKGALTPALVERMDAIMQALTPALEAISDIALLHGDYQFENVLCENGHVTGILDFEWSKAGDPSWDFQVEQQWADECPGSREYVYSGYESVRPLDPQHPDRATLYLILRLLDDVVEQFGEPGTRSANALALMLPLIARLERRHA